MKKIVFPLIEIVIDGLMIPMFFIKLFHEVGVLPGMDKDGNQIFVKNDYYYSPMTNLYDSGQIWIMYTTFVFIGLTILFAMLSIIIDDKRIKVINKLIFGLSILIFMVAISLSSMVARGY